MVKEGRHVYINRIEIFGNDRTDDEVIRRELKVAEGDPYNATCSNAQNRDFKT